MTSLGDKAKNNTWEIKCSFSAITNKILLKPHSGQADNWMLLRIGYNRDLDPWLIKVAEALL